MTILDVLYGLIFAPQGTMRELSRTRPLLAAFVVFVGVYFANYLLREASRSINQGGLDLPGYSPWLWGTMEAVVVVVLWFVAAGVFSLLAEVIYGYGNAKGLLTCLGFAVFPGIIGTALYYMAALADLNSLGAVFYMLSVFWVMGLQVLAVREALTLTTGQAVLIYLLPAASTLLMFLLLLIIGGLALSSLPLL